MNEIKLKGKISNIEFSHVINNTEYQKANLEVPKENGEFDIKRASSFLALTNEIIEDSLNIFGKAEFKKEGWTIQNPDFEIEEDGENIFKVNLLNSLKK